MWTNNLFDIRFKQWNGRERSLYFELPAFYTPVEQLMESPKGGISVLQGKRVAKIDAKAQLAYLEDGTTIGYDKCLIATGGKPKSLPQLDNVPAEIKDKVTLFRKIEDFKNLEAVASEAKSITSPSFFVNPALVKPFTVVWVRSPKIVPSSLFQYLTLTIIYIRFWLHELAVLLQCCQKLFSGHSMLVKILRQTGELIVYGVGPHSLVVGNNLLIGALVGARDSHYFFPAKKVKHALHGTHSL